MRKKLKFCRLTVTAEDVAELGLGPPGELLLLERFPYHLVVAENDDVILPEPQAQHGPVLPGQLQILQVGFAFEEGQISYEGDAEGAGRQQPSLPPAHDVPRQQDKDQERAHSQRIPEQPTDCQHVAKYWPPLGSPALIYTSPPPLHSR